MRWNPLFAWVVMVQLVSLPVLGETSEGTNCEGGKMIGDASACSITVGPEGVLLRNGRPYRAIGVNYFDAFYRTLENPADKSYKEGFDVLAEHGIPFVRFSATGYWPVHFQPYVTDREAYYQLFDEFVASAEEHHIGLIPSVFWTAQFMLPDLVGEKCNQWGDPDSETIALARDIVSGLATRYANRPTIWAWEFGNEGNLAIDLPNAADWRPPTQVSLGNPATRNAEDDWTH
jgi:hypothetical protein